MATSYLDSESCSTTIEPAVLVPSSQDVARFVELKAIVGLERGGTCFTDPVYPDDEGLNLLDWDGECLTFEGEINKLAPNVAIGR